MLGEEIDYWTEVQGMLMWIALLRKLMRIIFFIVTGACTICWHRTEYHPKFWNYCSSQWSLWSNTPRAINWRGTVYTHFICNSFFQLPHIGNWFSFGYLCSQSRKCDCYIMLLQTVWLLLLQSQCYSQSIWSSMHMACSCYETVYDSFT